MLKSVLTFILAFSLLQTLSALDLLQQEKWVSWHKAKITRVKDADGQTVVRITLPKTEKKITYAAADCTFLRPMDLSDYKELKMTVRSSQMFSSASSVRKDSSIRAAAGNPPQASSSRKTETA